MANIYGLIKELVAYGEKNQMVLAEDRVFTMNRLLEILQLEDYEDDGEAATGMEYGTLDVTINLSKPEKDPKAIAAAKNAKQSGYPKCLLCKENEGYAGRVNYPARQNHRIIPVTIVGGSILAHEHFQGGHYEFAMERAEIKKEVTISGFMRFIDSL